MWERGAVAAAEDIQKVVYGVGRREPFLDLVKKGKDGRPGVSLDWFNMLYQVLLGQEKGPRFGSFVAVYGLPNAIVMIDGALARSAELVVPANAGTHSHRPRLSAEELQPYRRTKDLAVWVPAFAGTTLEGSAPLRAASSRAATIRDSRPAVISAAHLPNRVRMLARSLRREAGNKRYFSREKAMQFRV